MSTVQSAVKSHAEAVQVSRAIDYLGLFILFFVVLGGFHVHAMLTMGDWDFWSDWKDRRLWVTVTPIMLVTFPAAVQAIVWQHFRIPFGATLCCIGLVLGEWINRYFNFWGWTYFPINIVFPAILTPGAILLDGVLALTNSFLATAVFGATAFALIFYPCNWIIIAGLHMPVEYHGILMTIADISGYNYVRTGTPEYIRMIEKGTLRTFGKDVAPVSAFFSAFVCIMVYFIWHFFGRWYGTTKFLNQT